MSALTAIARRMCVPSKRGAALPTVVIVAAVALILGAGIFSAANVSSQISRASTAGRQAYLNAKSGVEYSIAAIERYAAINGTLPDRFHAAGAIEEAGGFTLSFVEGVPGSASLADEEIFVDGTVSGGPNEFTITVTSVGRGNRDSLTQAERDVRHTIRYTADVLVTQSVEVPGVIDIMKGAGFDPSIIVSDDSDTRFAYKSVLSGGYVLKQPTLSTDRAVLFQQPVIADTSYGLEVGRAYFAAPASLEIKAGNATRFQADQIHIAGELRIGSGASMILTPRTEGRTGTAVYFGPQASMLVGGDKTRFDPGKLFWIPAGTDLVQAIRSGIAEPLVASDPIAIETRSKLDNTVLQFGEKDALPLGSFLSGTAVGWVGPGFDLRGGAPSWREGSAMAFYAGAGGGAEWVTSCQQPWRAQSVRLVWDSTDPLLVPSPQSDESSFTVIADVQSFDIGSPGAAVLGPADPGAGYIVKTESGNGNVMLFVAHEMLVRQKSGIDLPLSPGWHSVRSGSDLFDIAPDELDTLFVVDSDLNPIKGNQGTELLQYISVGRVVMEGNIAVPKNKRVEVLATGFEFTGSQITHNTQQGNEKHTLLLIGPVGVKSFIVTFESTIQVEQVSGEIITFQAGSYVMDNPTDLLNFGPTPPKPYVPVHDVTFSNGTYR